MKAADRWIVVPNWGDFQHYKDRDPTWIKFYTRLMSDAEYMRLSFRLRGILGGIWLLYAASDGQVLGSSPAQLGRMIGGEEVRTRDIEALVHAGFIQLSASKPLALRYQVASPEKEAEPEEEKEELPEQGEPLGALVEISEKQGQRIQPLIDVLPLNEVKPNTRTVLASKFAALPAHFVELAREELLAAQDVRSPVRYLNGIADRMLIEQGRGAA